MTKGHKDTRVKRHILKIDTGIKKTKAVQKEKT